MKNGKQKKKDWTLDNYKNRKHCQNGDKLKD